MSKEALKNAIETLWFWLTCPKIAFLERRRLRIAKRAAQERFNNFMRSRGSRKET